MEYARNFGRLPKKEVYADLRKHAGINDNSEQSSKGEKAIAWLSYFTMVYAAIIAFTPHTAAAAALHVGILVN